jgi:hypothetical protein
LKYFRRNEIYYLRRKFGLQALFLLPSRAILKTGVPAGAKRPKLEKLSSLHSSSHLSSIA